MQKRAFEMLRRLTVTKILFLCYFLIVVVGAVILSLPVSVRAGESHRVLDGFFTSASAACVTGLVRFDTYSHWSPFGQSVILVLIQVGGIGFMTLCVSALSVTRYRIGLVFRSLTQNAVSAPELGGIVRSAKFIVIFTAAVETAGAILLSFWFCPRYGTLRGIWYSVFHSVSAFCNAGFDLMGGTSPFSSFTSASGSAYLNIVLMLLIIFGGLGFFTWRDIFMTKCRLRRFKLQTKVVLSVSAALTVIGAVLFYLLERVSGSGSATVLEAVFQSVTCRTAGFNTVNLAALSQSTKLVMIALMLVGGAPGSTAGGIKVTTAAVLAVSVRSTLRQRRSAEMFGRRLDDTSTRTAVCVLMMYLGLALTSSVVLNVFDGVGMLDAMFESFSAVATVGLTAGATPTLGAVSALVLSALMIFGRVGSLTMLFALASEKGRTASSLPLEKLQIG